MGPDRRFGSAMDPTRRPLRTRGVLTFLILALVLSAARPGIASEGSPRPDWRGHPPPGASEQIREAGSPAESFSATITLSIAPAACQSRVDEEGSSGLTSQECLAVPSGAPRTQSEQTDQVPFVVECAASATILTSASTLFFRNGLTEWEFECFDGLFFTIVATACAAVEFGTPQIPQVAPALPTVLPGSFCFTSTIPWTYLRPWFSVNFGAVAVQLDNGTALSGLFGPFLYRE